ncbi:hypothetical protein [Streptomyces sp. NPDC006879]|uniref:hypothetical protein n=1 Tax=Streptomyces sp. NPDC006879 TaxID=3364767 RepID=UPI0036C73F0E
MIASRLSSRRSASAPRWCRALWCAVLLLGIATMHTLGHPAEAHGGHGTVSHTAIGAAGESTDRVQGVSAEARTIGKESGGGPIISNQHHLTVPTVAPDASQPPAQRELPLGATDTAALCLAVLGALALGLYAPMAVGGSGRPLLRGCPEPGRGAGAGDRLGPLAGRIVVLRV